MACLNGILGAIFEDFDGCWKNLVFDFNIFGRWFIFSARFDKDMRKELEDKQAKAIKNEETFSGSQYELVGGAVFSFLFLPSPSLKKSSSQA